jgi:hypothetical protein
MRRRGSWRRPPGSRSDGSSEIHTAAGADSVHALSVSLVPSLTANVRISDREYCHPSFGAV